jgi:hypothetical protein
MRSETFGAHGQLKKYKMPVYESQAALKFEGKKILSEAADTIPSADPSPNRTEEEFCGKK